MSEAKRKVVEVHRAEFLQLLGHLEALKEMRLRTLKQESQRPIKNIRDAQLTILNLWISRIEFILRHR